MGPTAMMMGDETMSARLEVVEALLRGEISREEAQRRTAAIKRTGWSHIESLLRPRRGRLLSRIERIERAAYQ
jgi:hypothetical protein